MPQQSHHISWKWSLLRHLPVILAYRLFALREAVFIVEQQCAYQELDGKDESAWHLLGLSNNDPVTCLRVLPPASVSGHYRIGRVAVDAAWRGKGLARQLVELAIRRIRDEAGHANIVLDAQTYLRTFYESMGFYVTGDEFAEDGIPHIPMQIDWSQAAAHEVTDGL